MTASLYTGTANKKLMDTKVSQNVTLTVPGITTPSLKLTGSQRLLTASDTLDLTVSTKNVEGCTVSAIIEKKQNGTYSGNFLTVDNVKDGEQSFGLGGLANSGDGSYRLLVTVSKDGQSLLEVPYYFIYQKSE